ncbi:hypothetical protein H9M94_00270 [Mycoplasma sp. Pen4]|uniref:hypothetical protein n=1 Tax=Mycoplasma sp. Pen4 TaxID=640330 RepID=UPI0016545109|nr:hypothetical protein [Mycoplasma sp. Pen4]QNM93700.1 hypothetical protein H9M94_00270 [Mycoplasma sp. Pen4]
MKQIEFDQHMSSVIDGKTVIKQFWELIDLFDGIKQEKSKVIQDTIMYLLSLIIENNNTKESNWLDRASLNDYYERISITDLNANLDVVARYIDKIMSNTKYAYKHFDIFRNIKKVHNIYYVINYNFVSDNFNFIYENVIINNKSDAKQINNFKDSKISLVSNCFGIPTLYQIQEISTFYNHPTHWFNIIRSIPNKEVFIFVLDDLNVLRGSIINGLKDYNISVITKKDNALFDETHHMGLAIKKEVLIWNISKFKHLKIAHKKFKKICAGSHKLHLKGQVYPIDKIHSNNGINHMIQSIDKKHKFTDVCLKIKNAQAFERLQCTEYHQINEFIYVNNYAIKKPEHLFNLTSCREIPLIQLNIIKHLLNKIKHLKIDGNYQETIMKIVFLVTWNISFILSVIHLKDITGYSKMICINNLLKFLGITKWHFNPLHKGLKGIDELNLEALICMLKLHDFAILIQELLKTKV